MPRVDYFKNSEKFVEYPANQVIFDKGDPADAMYAVKEGEVDILYNGYLLDTVEAGEFFGEMSLVDDTPLFALQVMHLMAERLRRMNELVERWS